MRSATARREYSWRTLIPVTLALLWAAHGVVVFAHEYAHTFTAWVLGWKRNPFALNYAHRTVTVFLTRLGISQNVEETPIFASGHGAQAASISVAGALLGNGLITFPLSRLLDRLDQSICLRILMLDVAQNDLQVLLSLGSLCAPLQPATD